MGCESSVTQSLQIQLCTCIQHSSDLHKGAVLGRRNLWRSQCPQHSVAVQGDLTAQLGSAKAGGSWSFPCWLSSSAGPSWLTLLLGTRGCCWPRQMEAGGCREDGLSTPPKVLGRVPLRQQPNKGFSPVPRIHHHCESSNSGPELLPLPKQPGPAPAPSPCSAHSPVPSKAPTWALLPCRLLLSTKRGSLLPESSTLGCVSPCRDQSRDPGNTIWEWEGRASPIPSLQGHSSCALTELELLGISRNLLGSAPASSRCGNLIQEGPDTNPSCSPPLPRRITGHHRFVFWQ